MNYYPSFLEADTLKNGYGFLPVCCEIMADTHTPVNLFWMIRSLGKHCCLLETAESERRWGRYSFIGFDPCREIIVKDGKVRLIQGNCTRILDGQPLDIIEKLLNTAPRIPGLPPFTGGFVGYFGYDTVRYIEPKLGASPEDDLELPDIHLLDFRNIIAFDHLRHKLILIQNIEVNDNFEQNYTAAAKKLEELSFMILKMGIPPLPGREKPSSFKMKSNVTKQRYCEMVESAKRYIRDGDAFQIVLSQRFKLEDAPHPFTVYRMLRATNPSPYMYYFHLDGLDIAGASPEKLVSLEDEKISSRPIAGTKPRGKDEKSDNKMENFLLSDPKEQAEHTMLVDLGRNDVGKVSRFGTVEVTRFMEVERFSRVMHLVSDIQGKLEKGNTAMDVLRACIPAGTLSGAPKVRAMEIIDELENIKRGVYGGAIGYMAYTGDMDVCIAIRTVAFKNGNAYIQAGAGIVADSDPEQEYEETLAKASAIFEAIEEAGNL